MLIERFDKRLVHDIYYVVLEFKGKVKIGKKYKRKKVFLTYDFALYEYEFNKKLGRWVRE